MRWKPKLFYGWWIVAAAFIIQLFAGGVVFYGFTAVFQPLRDEFGWSYTQISFAASLRGMEETISAPLWGFLADRLGPKRLLFGGSVLAALGLLLLSRTNSLVMFYLSFVLLAVGIGACSITVLMTAVANWFRKNLGLATGIVMCGYGFGGLMVPVVVKLMDALGWRLAIVITGLAVLAVIMPLSLLVRHKPEQYGCCPDGEANEPGAANSKLTSASPVEFEVTGRQALRTRAFWQLTLSILCQFLVLGAVVTHVMPFLDSVGVARSTASFVASAVPLVSIIGRFGLGWLGDKADNRWLMVAACALMGTGMLFFGTVSANTLWLLVPFLAFFSIGYGGNNTIRASLLRGYFGRSHYGTIYGLMMGIGMLGSIIGAPVAGWVFDTWGRYQGVWFAFAGLIVVALVLVATLPAKNSGPALKGLKLSVSSGGKVQDI